MISRYERAKSSPLKRIGSLSRALDIPKSSLLERHIPEECLKMGYRVPLFTQLPSTCKFSENQTNYFYNCPEWIIKRDRKTIAMEGSLIRSGDTEFKSNGLVYISTQTTPTRNDLIIVKQNGELVAKKYNGDIKFNILGKVLAQEIRY